MLNLYIVEATVVRYDENDSVLICAYNEEQALVLAQAEFTRKQGPFTVIPVILDKPKVLHISNKGG